MGNGWEMAGVYPTYVFQAGAFLAGSFFFLKSRSLFIKSHLFDVFMINLPFIIKKARPRGLRSAAALARPARLACQGPLVCIIVKQFYNSIPDYTPLE